jgi:hypothetical protein
VKKTGFIIKNIAKGRTYFYLRRSVWENGISKPKNVFSLGNKEKALDKINSWFLEGLPEELTKLGFNKDDLQEWLEKIAEE